MRLVSVILAAFCVHAPVIFGAKILAIFPFPGPSQYIAVQPYLKALAARGHELTVLNHHPQKKKLNNFRDIQLKSNRYDEFIQHMSNLTDEEERTQMYIEFGKQGTLCVLESQEVQALMRDKSQRFDLLIVETLWNDALFGLAPHFGAHLIGFSSLGTDKYMDDLMGNDSPLSYIPIVLSSNSPRMGFMQRLENLWMYINEHLKISRPVLALQEEIYEKYFSHLKVPLHEVRRNFSLLLLNQHFSLSIPRPYVPNMIEVGGFFLNHKPTPLPKDIEEFIENSEHGVIYFSMGSNFKSKFFTPEKRAVLLNVFAKLKQRILWKFEDPDLPGKPENVFISKWFPQPDILAHPNVKLFITHGGLLSTIEAIYHAKPVVGIPVFYDQFMNIERAKGNGFGLSVSFKDLNEQDLTTAITEILSNPKYTEAVRKMSARYHDQPIKPLDNAIFWTEYVLRHNGAGHMRVAGRNLNFFQFYCLDTLGFMFGLVLSIGLIFIFIISKVVKLFTGGNSKSKRKSNKRD